MFLKIASVEYESPFVEAFSKVIDAKPGSKALERLKNQVSDELSFQPFPGYLLHASCLQ